jgi:hypothetical protein
MKVIRPEICQFCLIAFKHQVHVRELEASRVRIWPLPQHALAQLPTHYRHSMRVHFNGSTYNFIHSCRRPWVRESRRRRRPLPHLLRVVSSNPDMSAVLGHSA